MGYFKELLIELGDLRERKDSLRRNEFLETMKELCIKNDVNGMVQYLHKNGVDVSPYVAYKFIEADYFNRKEEI